MAQPKITDIILDFDGTCTQIPALQEIFLEKYFELFAAVFVASQQPVLTKEEWSAAIALVRKNSPHTGWVLSTCSSAPAAADPYILSGEAAGHIIRQRQPDKPLQGFDTLFKNADMAAPPAWRPEAAAVFKALQDKGINLHFISNSSTTKIKNHLAELPGIKDIAVIGNAAKYNIRELTWDPLPQDVIPEEAALKFAALPASCASSIGRPVYLRRGSFFECICKALNNDLGKLPSTVFCGDIWELDLAMPYELGANIHLIERAAPFDTYPYELDMVKSYKSKGRISNNLTGLLQWV